MVVDARKITTDERLAALTLPSGGGWLGAARKNALGRLQAVGLPTRRDEYWRYTNPAPFNRATPAQGAGGPGEDPFAGIDAYVITIDGDALDLPDGAPDGVEINTLSQAAEADIHWARDLYATLEVRRITPRFAAFCHAQQRLRHRRSGDPRDRPGRAPDPHPHHRRH